MKVVLKDGTEIQNVLVVKSNNTLELTMAKLDAITFMPKFVDEDAMSEITYISGAWITIYRGYRRFSHLDNPQNDTMLVWMDGAKDETSVEQQPRFEEIYMPKGE